MQHVLATSGPKLLEPGDHTGVAGFPGAREDPAGRKRKMGAIGGMGGWGGVKRREEGEERGSHLNRVAGCLSFRMSFT